jgi:hypothetical protein
MGFLFYLIGKIKREKIGQVRKNCVLENFEERYPSAGTGPVWLAAGKSR